MRIKKGLLLLLVQAAAVAALLGSSGCGSDQATDASLTKAQYAKKADLICSNAADTQFEQAAIYSRAHPKATEADLMVPVAIPPTEKELRELEDLPIPENAGPQIEAFISEFTQALAAMKKKPTLALNPKTNPFVQANEMAEKLNLGDCSQSP